MPAKSKAQQRFFGMVDAYKKGELDNASKAVRDAADGMSKKEVKDFASTKHKGLPNRVKKEKKNEGRIVRKTLTEEQLYGLIEEAVSRVISNINEAYDPNPKYCIEDEADGSTRGYYNDLYEAIMEARKMGRNGGKYLVVDREGNVIYDTNPGVSYKF